MIRGVRGMLLAGVLVAAGCSGGDDGAEPTIAPTAPSTAAPTTTVAPTTTTPPPTTPVPTTAPPTTLPPPTAPPTSPAPDPLSDLAANLQRDATAAENVLFQVLNDPSRADSEELLRRYFAADALESVLATLATFREDDLNVVENPAVPVTLLITGPPTLIEGSDPPRVSVETCRLDSAILMAPLVGSEVRAPINDRIYRTDAQSTFVLIDGIWRIEGGTTISESEGDTTCD
jgi:hypothetical protein